MLTSRPRGTNDFLPGEVESWQELENRIRQLFTNFNYQEIRTPIFEHTELFLRSVGESSDIVEKEMYSFEDKGLRHITLRPEGTASTVRAFLENRLFAKPLPQKLYYIGPMFRYDQPQAGRYRQFHQFGCEVLGSADALVDAEVITYVMTLFSQLGLDHLSVSLNTVGCAQCRPAYEAALTAYFRDHYEELCPTCQRRLDINPLRILDCKEPKCAALASQAPNMQEHACDDCQTHFSDVRHYLDAAHIPYFLDATLVRGLDYYTQTAFEVMMTGKSGQQSAICGGGRYNRLVAECGGEDMPGMGFAAGMERLLLVLKENGISLGRDCHPTVYFAPLDKPAKELAFEWVLALRQMGISAELDLMNKSLKAQLKTADRLQVAYAVLLGEEERENKKVTVRDLATSEQETVPFDEVLEYLREKVTHASVKKNS